MSISTIYTVSVNVPEVVWLNFKGRPEYDRAVIEAMGNYLEGGTNSYSTIEHWAEFHTLSEAQACEKALMNVNYKFAAKLLSNL